MLELVSQRHAPVGAYDTLGALRKGEGALAPPTVYRALEFLIEAGLIHRIDTLNASIACVSPEEMHAGRFLVRRTCSRVTELDDATIARLVMQKAKAAGFASDSPSVEIKGVCGDCSRASSA